MPSTCLPSKPPFAFTSSINILTVLLSQVPQTAWSPVKDPIQPILIVSDFADVPVSPHAVITIVKTNITLISVKNFLLIEPS